MNPTTLAPAVPTDDDLWQTLLFLPSPTPRRVGHVSARLAYQQALYGRAVVLDLRDDATRAREGVIGADLPVVRHLADAVATGLDLLVIGAASAPLVVADTRRSAVVDGGMAAWRAAGLPVVDVHPLAAAA